jgi:hypothetical protein
MMLWTISIGKRPGGRNATRRVDEAGHVQRSPAADIRHSDSYGSGIDALAGSPILKIVFSASTRNITTV